MELELIQENTWNTISEKYTPEYSVKLDYRFLYVGGDYDKALALYNKIKDSYQPPTKTVLFQTTLQ